MIPAKALRLSLTRRSLSRFAQAMMPSFELASCHKFIIEYLEKLLSNEITKLAVTTPPAPRKIDAWKCDDTCICIG